MEFIKEATFSLQNGPALEAELSGLAGKLQADLDDMRARQRAIEQDATLSALGREQRLAELYGEKRNALDAFKRKVNADLEQRSSNMAGALSRAVRLPEISDARAAVIWTWFQGIDPVQRPVVLAEAVQSGDYELVSAVMGAPRCIGLVADSVRLDVQRRLEAKAAPEHAATAGDLDVMRQVMRANLKRYERALEPLRTVALQVDPGRFDPLFRQAGRVK